MSQHQVYVREMQFMGEYPPRQMGMLQNVEVSIHKNWFCCQIPYSKINYQRTAMLVRPGVLERASRATPPITRLLARAPRDHGSGQKLQESVPTFFFLCG
jgi:hypothetical protein